MIYVTSKDRGTRQSLGTSPEAVEEILHRNYLDLMSMPLYLCSSYMSVLSCACDIPRKFRTLLLPQSARSRCYGGTFSVRPISCQRPSFAFCCKMHVGSDFDMVSLFRSPLRPSSRRNVTTNIRITNVRYDDGQWIGRAKIGPQHENQAKFVPFRLLASIFPGRLLPSSTKPLAVR